MKIVCTYCEKVYQVPDHKIPLGKKLTAKCKVCGNGIVVERKPRATVSSESRPVSNASIDITRPEKEIEDHTVSSIQSVDPKGSIGGLFSDQKRVVFACVILVCLLVAIGLAGKGVYSIVGGDSSANGSKVSARFVRGVAEEARTSVALPLRINNQVQLTDIEAKDRELVYSYTFVNFDSQELAQLSLVTDMKSGLVKVICNGEIPRTYSNKKLVYRFAVYGNDNIFVSSTQFDLADCR